MFAVFFIVFLNEVLQPKNNHLLCSKIFSVAECAWTERRKRQFTLQWMMIQSAENQTELCSASN